MQKCCRQTYNGYTTIDHSDESQMLSKFPMLSLKNIGRSAQHRFYGSSQYPHKTIYSNRQYLQSENNIKKSQKRIPAFLQHKNKCPSITPNNSINDQELTFRSKPKQFKQQYKSEKILKEQNKPIFKKRISVHYENAQNNVSSASKNDNNKIQFRKTINLRNCQKKKSILETPQKSLEFIRKPSKSIAQGINFSHKNLGIAFKYHQIIPQQRNNIKSARFYKSQNKQLKFQFRSIKKLQYNNYKSPQSTNLSSTILSQNCILQDFELGLMKNEGKNFQVCPARHKKTGFLVNIKKIPKKIVLPILQNFIKEIKLQSMTEDPYVVQFYQIFSDEENLYVIYEILEEGTLFTSLKIQQKFTQKETSQKILQVLYGLKNIHQTSIVHRNLKPSSIYLSNGVCKISDFSLATFCNNTRNSKCGARGYTSPQVTQGEDYAFAADIWSIGILTYELLFGRIPFSNINNKKSCQIFKVHYPQTISDQAQDFIEGCLKPNAEDRYSIQELLSHQFLKRQREYKIDFF